MTLPIYLLFFLILGIIFPRSKFICFIIILFVWILNFNISNPDYIPLQTTYESESYGEVGYRYLCKIFNSRGVEYFFFKLIIAALSLLLFYKFIITYAEFPAYVAALYMMVCPLDVVQNRNFFAFMILINAIPLLGRFSVKNLLIYYSVLLLSCSIHASMAFFVFLPFVQKEVISYFLKSKGTIILLSILLLPVVYYFLTHLLDTDVQSRSQAYFVNPTSLITKIGVLLLCFINYTFVRRYRRYTSGIMEEENNLKPSSYLVFNPNGLVLSLNKFFLLFSPLIMINITFLRLFRFVVLINLVYMLNVIFYSKRGSYTLVSLYSIISLFIGFVLHRETFIVDVLIPFFSDNLIIR